MYLYDERLMSDYFDNQKLNNISHNIVLNGFLIMIAKNKLCSLFIV